MVGYRLISGDSLLKTRSFCPSCKQTIAWYDLIPLASWLLLKGKCRLCSAPISWLYFFIEAVSAVSLSALFFFKQTVHFPLYFMFFSALIITIRTDFEHMLISRYVTLFLLPMVFGASFFGYLPVTLIESLLGAVSAYLFLYIINFLFFACTQKVGLGQGDGELLAFIGACIGITGWWITLLVGSLLGSCYGILYIVITQQNRYAKIPFGPFLAFGAMLYCIFEHQVRTILGL